VTVGRGLAVAAVCAASFGASFVAGNALLDADESPQVRPAGSAPPVERAPSGDRPRLALALGRAADLPRLRTPPQRVRDRQAGPGPPAPVAPSAGTSDGAAQSVASTPPAPAPPAPTQPVNTTAPTPQWSPPPTPPAPSTSSQPSSAAPRPDATPSPPKPAPDPAPSGGAQYSGGDDR
jgi:hypothetical protein